MGGVLHRSVVPVCLQPHGADSSTAAGRTARPRCWPCRTRQTDRSSTSSSLLATLWSACHLAALALLLAVLVLTGRLRSQRYFGTAVGKGRQAAKTEIEKLKLEELSCRQGVVEVARMCVPPCVPASRGSGAQQLTREGATSQPSQCARRGKAV